MWVAECMLRELPGNCIYIVNLKSISVLQYSLLKVKTNTLYSFKIFKLINAFTFNCFFVKVLNEDLGIQLQDGVGKTAISLSIAFTKEHSISSF